MSCNVILGLGMPFEEEIRKVLSLCIAFTRVLDYASELAQLC